ncbi:heparan-sulfate 6-O-sulfotransferase 2-like [Ornithodoros turicata]|uniref:heparan-sulfate 6-O-sulfotransferase 2-like n=1 Tax=Ornithodoros turicata TaxID=34597 RepID=UPI00313865F9
MHGVSSSFSGTFCRTLAAGSVSISVFVFILFCYFNETSSPQNGHHWLRLKSAGSSVRSPDSQSTYLSRQRSLNADDGNSSNLIKFDITASDVIVFLQIQNAGANFFERHLIRDLNLEQPCSCWRQKICRCYRPGTRTTWLFSRYTLGWKCGVHPDWTELTNCVDRVLDEDEGRPVKRRYFYITVLRDPVTRFRSEWHRFRQNRGWHGSRPHRSRCSSGIASDALTQPCFDGRHPTNVTWDEFLSCSTNPALNRQTRMLANLGLIDACSETASGVMRPEDRDLVLLSSAKLNLQKMAFFGLAEFPKLSQSMFEATFNLSFKRRARSRNFLRGRRYGKKFMEEKMPGQVERVTAANSLDVELYNHAKELLFSRFEKVKGKDPELSEDEREVMEPYSGEDWADEEDLSDLVAE